MISKSSTIAKQERHKLIKLLIDQIQQCSDSKTKQWFDNYLKGAIEYRGVKTPQVTKLVRDWRLVNRLDFLTPLEQLALCSDLITSSFAEDKFAGTIYIQKFLLSDIDYQILLSELNLLFQQGYFFDWSTTDWVCARVLDAIAVKNGVNAAETIAQWRHSANLWQRRASIVSFRHASLDRDYHPLIKVIIDDLVREKERFIQTGIGWLLADMSKHYPTEVEILFRKYLHELDKEVVDRHSKYLPCYKELKQQKRKLLLGK